MEATKSLRISESDFDFIRLKVFPINPITPDYIDYFDQYNILTETMLDHKFGKPYRHNLYRIKRSLDAFKEIL